MYNASTRLFHPSGHKTSRTPSRFASLADFRLSATNSMVRFRLQLPPVFPAKLPLSISSANTATLYRTVPQRTIIIDAIHLDLHPSIIHPSIHTHTTTNSEKTFGTAPLFRFPVPSCKQCFFWGTCMHGCDATNCIGTRASCWLVSFRFLSFHFVDSLTNLTAHIISAGLVGWLIGWLFHAIHSNHFFGK